MKQLSEPEALNKAAALCMQSERCISEISNKLQAWGQDDATIHRIINRLINEKFIDEARYCRAYVNDKIRFNRWGRIKIAAALHEKKLPREYITAAIEEVDEEQYISVLKSVISAKQKDLRGKDDYAAKQKIIRHAIAKGFEPHLIMQTVKDTSDEVDFRPY